MSWESHSQILVTFRRRGYDPFFRFNVRINMRSPRTDSVRPSLRTPQSSKDARSRFGSRKRRLRGSRNRSMNSSLALIVRSRSPRNDSLGRRSSCIVHLLPHRVSSQHRGRRRWPAGPWRNAISFCHPPWSRGWGWRHSTCIRDAHNVVRSCCSLVEVSGQYVASLRSYVILIHEMLGTVSDAVDITNAALVVIFVFAIQGHPLKSASELLVRSLLTSALVDFVMVCWWSRSPESTWPVLPFRFRLCVFWYLHMLQPVCLDGFVVEPWTVTSLPFEATYHTKLRCTATRRY